MRINRALRRSLDEWYGYVEFLASKGGGIMTNRWEDMVVLALEAEWLHSSGGTFDPEKVKALARGVLALDKELRRGPDTGSVRPFPR